MTNGSKRSLLRTAGRVLPFAIACSVALSPTVAAAQDTGEAPAARADRLFREGKTALEAHHYAEACPKLAESQQLDPGTGTLLALGLCHEGMGATATAWHEFTDVFAASEKRPDRATLAKKHIQTLEAVLSTVSVAVRPESQAHVTVRVDGNEILAAVWAKPFPLDPGDHTVEAQVPGGTVWKSVVHVAPGPSTRAVVVPAIEPAAPAAAVAALPPPRYDGSRRLVVWSVGGAGAGLFVLGSIFGGVALAEHGSAKSLCPSSPCPSSAGVSDESQAKTFAWISDFGIGLGLVGLGTAAYLYFTQRSGDAAPATPIASTLRVRPSFDVRPGGGGVSLTTEW